MEYYECKKDLPLERGKAGVGGMVGLGGWYASKKVLYLENCWTKFKKWICFGISMNWGIKLALKS